VSPQDTAQVCPRRKRLDHRAGLLAHGVRWWFIAEGRFSPPARASRGLFLLVRGRTAAPAGRFPAFLQETAGGADGRRFFPE